jgi:branched-chain amino acid transport system substrate-binding protein
MADEAARRFPKTKAAIVYPELDFGLSYRDGLQGGLAAQGAPIPSIIPYPSRATDLKPTIERLAETKAPVVFIVGSQGDVRRLVQGARERGVKAPIFLGGDISGSLADGFGPAGEGAIAAIDGFDPAAGDPRTQAFVTAFRGRFGVLPSYFNATTYDALGVVTSLMRQGATTGPALREALYKTRGYIQVTGGELVFDRDGESGLPPRLVELRGGKLQPAR